MVQTLKSKLYFLILCSFLISCANLKEVGIEDIKSPQLKGLSGTTAKVEVQVKINNPSQHKLYLKELDFDILRNGYSFAHASLQDRVEIAKRSNQYYPIVINVQFTDVFALAAGGLKMLSNPDALKEFTLEGTAKGGNWFMNKTRKINNQSFNGN